MKRLLASAAFIVVSASAPLLCTAAGPCCHHAAHKGSSHRPGCRPAYPPSHVQDAGWGGGHRHGRPECHEPR